jgi:indole-3-glycerol phosphate synthase/phosphoribosylanthranilate isomerase
LFDTKVNHHSGGTGVAFDWSRVAQRSDLPRGILAGGLKPSNAREAAKLGAYALDVSSGVEAAPGRKDPGKLQAFFDALRVPVREEQSC